MNDVEPLERSKAPRTAAGRPAEPIDPATPGADLHAAMRALREESGLTMRQLVSRMSYATSVSFLSRLERGDARPRWEQVEAFVRACGVTEPAALARWRHQWGMADSAAQARRSRLRTRPASPSVVRDYLERLRSRYQRLDLEPLSGPTEGLTPVTLPAVFVAPSVRDLDPAAGGRVAPALELLADPDQPRVVLLGDPGSGKSTLLRYLALSLTEEAPPGPLARLTGTVPLLLDMRTWADPRWRDTTFLDLIDHQCRTEGIGLPRATLDPYLTDGGPALVMFDGLDEITDPPLRETTSHQVAAFAARYPRARIVVTARPAGYRQHILNAAGFTHHRIEALTRKSIEELAERLLATGRRGDEPGEDELARRLTRAIAASPDTSELARNPLLLTMLLQVGFRRGHLPRDRATLYRQVLRLLLESWDLNKHLPRADLDEADKLELLQLAARLTQNLPAAGAGDGIPAAELLRRWEDHLRGRYDLPYHQSTALARDLLTQLVERNFLLREIAHGRFGFVHETIREWLLASAEPETEPAPARTAAGVSELVAALESVSEACVRVGSVLIVKYPGPDGPVLVVRPLSEPEMGALDRLPEIQARPRDVLSALASAVGRVPNTD